MNLQQSQQQLKREFCGYHSYIVRLLETFGYRTSKLVRTFTYVEVQRELQYFYIGSKVVKKIASVHSLQQVIRGLVASQDFPPTGWLTKSPASFSTLRSG